MSVNGIWRNGYGSIMTLAQDDGGRVSGTYRSSTGSSGTYRVVGFADPGSPDADRGESLALSIFWRSIGGGTGDPSWHWVSGLGGQRAAADGGTPTTLNLIHALVATVDFPGLAPLGTYPDKLVYVPDRPDASNSEPAVEPSVPEAPPAGGAGDPIDGTWVCQDEPSTFLRLQVTGAASGDVSGSLTLPEGTFEALGFTDTYAREAGLALQGLTVCSLLQGTGKTVALAGSLSFESGVLTVTALTNQGTNVGSTYLQTELRILSFLKRPRDGG